VLYGERLVAAGLFDADERERLEREIASEIDDAAAFAEAGHLEPVEELERFVYSDPPPRSP
jgi:pyruvate dehydrogenase E1 component alpha subunit